MISRSPDETRSLGARLGRRAKRGDIICLCGPLGSGKTTFVQGFVRGAGFKGAAASPTFALARSYRLAGGRVIHHLDLYRVSTRDIPNLGLEEYLNDPRAVCLIEWPEVAWALLARRRAVIRLSHSKDGGRRIDVRAPGSRGNPRGR